jgi:hypothetical protein
VRGIIDFEAMDLEEDPPTAPYAKYPGGDLVEAGLRDLTAGVRSPEALLVASFTDRLRRLGIPVPEHDERDPEHGLYLLLAEDDPRAAHARYNALVQRLVSFAQARECVRSRTRLGCRHSCAPSERPAPKAASTSLAALPRCSSGGAPRYPSVDPASFRAAVVRSLGPA